MIDLHTHSTFSDGDCSPTELMAQARDAGLTAIALTDHDSTAGIPEFMSAGNASESPGITCVPGVEISAEAGRGTMHILGYFIDWQNRELAAVLARLRQGRDQRNDLILEKLRRLKMPLTHAEAADRAGDEVVGRPHIAGALVARGYVGSVAEAFRRFLAKGKRAYVDRFRLPPEDSIAALRQAGGVTVLAHPGTLELGQSALRETMGRLRGMGLQGLEVYYPAHGPEQTREFLTLAKEFNLVVTGGTDYHGSGHGALRLGVGFGSLSVPDELLAPLQARARHVEVS